MTALTYPQALAQVKSTVVAARTSFYAGMAVLPKARREGMYALYGFCRVVDDIADDSPSPEIAAKKLQEWRARISDVFRGKPSEAITTALLPAIRAFNLVEKDFQEIIDGMEMDSKSIVAPDFATLDLYCDRVASAVGRASVRIFGNVGADAMQVAHHLGRALQLTNILRDLAEDAARGRLYLPRELLEKHGIETRYPNDLLLDPKLPAVCRDLALKAREHYAQADACIKKCPAEAMRPARIMRDYYKAIFDRLLERDWRDPLTRVTLPKWKKIWLILKGFFG
ncbi:MAG: presqualene diphosphate synthase HpnD [Alphaproteobacteria bacterium]|nr:presqualene diphosphate synthase HpnD [Alphaproteobacteria bacterium]